MKSPFPGMDPYIEADGLWEGFHQHLIESIYRAVAIQLPQGYLADTATRSYIVLMETEGKKERQAQPDVTITEEHSRKGSRKKKNGGVAVAEVGEVAESMPMLAFVAVEFVESFVEIYATGEERSLVTCIEVLSPTNKRPKTEGWLQYKRKRQSMLLGRANFIEIDLLRGGKKHSMLTPWPSYPYTLLVSWAIDAPYCRVWRGDFLRRLPVIPVPLFDPDPDLQLDLQPLIEDIYELGRYDKQIDYRRALRPAFSEAEAAAVRELLKNGSSRTSRKGRK
jgi:hypothetical protein